MNGVLCVKCSDVFAGKDWEEEEEEQSFLCLGCSKHGVLQGPSWLWSTWNPTDASAGVL